MQLNMRSLVYVTSSHDLAYPPGVYRLLDLPVFAQAQCHDIPGAVCSEEGQALELTPTALTSANLDKDDEYWTGRQMIPRTRCRDEVESATGVACPRYPYYQDPSPTATGEMNSNSDAFPFCGAECAGCTQTYLSYGSDVATYPSTHWMSMLTAPPPVAAETAASRKMLSMRGWRKVRVWRRQSRQKVVHSPRPSPTLFFSEAMLLAT